MIEKGMLAWYVVELILLAIFIFTHHWILAVVTATDLAFLLIFHKKNKIKFEKIIGGKK